jgi:diguanylate cyclase (GGDEF)-like protein
VRPYSDGSEALAYIRSDPRVEALITSFELPAMSGMELCRETRSLSSSSRPIYIMLMSSDNEQSRMINALNHGADDFMRKPPAVEELYARLRAAERFGSMQRELARLATTDPLTGVANRRALFAAAEELCALADAGEALTAIMLDIDHFKRINDEFGHDAGDQVIRAVAREAAAEYDVVGRLGGEEFAILLSGQTRAAAAADAERLRVKFEAMRLEAGGEPVKFTCSFGVSEWRPDDTIDELLKRADAALYLAKSGGRNRVAADDGAHDAAQRSRTSSVIRSSAR